MQINIYVVKTEIDKQLDLNQEGKYLFLNAQLETLKLELIKLFNGLSSFQNGLGFWLNENKQLETDKIELWSILTEKENLETETETQLKQIIQNIKETTKQKCQLFTIDFKPFFV